MTAGQQGSPPRLAALYRIQGPPSSASGLTSPAHKAALWWPEPTTDRPHRRTEPALVSLRITADRGGLLAGETPFWLSHPAACRLTRPLSPELQISAAGWLGEAAMRLPAPETRSREVKSPAVCSSNG